MVCSYSCQPLGRSKMESPPQGLETRRKLKILYVSAEVAPYAKVGGLADVAASLPQALRALGHDVRIAMPAYHLVEHDPSLQVETVLEDVEVAINPWWSKAAYMRLTHFGEVPVYLLGTDEWFNEATSSESVYTPGADQYLFFARALLQCFEAAEWVPDIVHVNDWHMGFIPVLLREQHSQGPWAGVAAVMTIHNLAYQGEYSEAILDKVGLPGSLFNLHRLEAHGRVNFLKSGCVYSDKVNTVSQRYAEEIQTAGYGCGLDGLMGHLDSQGRLFGILNGIDTEAFDPGSDPRIPHHYSAAHPEGKAECRKELLSELGLKPLKHAPVASVVSRLSGQKGFDILADIVPHLVDLPMQVVVLATGDSYIAGQMRHLEAAFPKHVRFVDRFDPELAQRLYAGSDLFLMPSRYEPCGLGQMIALRYGSVPVVRETGGLADTIHEPHNGFVFQEFSPEPFLAACVRAHQAYNSPEWPALVQRGLESDFGWAASALKYEALYKAALQRRLEAAS